jgi:hypothetical protein
MLQYTHMEPTSRRADTSPLVQADAPHVTTPLEEETSESRLRGATGMTTGRLGPKQPIKWWEPFAIFWLTFLTLFPLASRVNNYLSPRTGDEPFYLMTAISLLQDGDLNECNNYSQEDEAQFYPQFYVQGDNIPRGWLGWTNSPYPLTPHPAILSPVTRLCSEALRGVPDSIRRQVPPGSGGTELYSKHGLGLTLLILPAYAAGGLLWVTLFLAMLAALLATNIYLLAREVTGLVVPAVLTWAAFALTVPFLPYSFLIFPELPAALLVAYAYRRIRAWGNNLWQTVGIGGAIAFLPWLHYRFVPVCAALMIYYLYQVWRGREMRPWSSLATVLLMSAGSAALLMAFFYGRYGQILPNSRDHAGSSDLAGTIRGFAGLLIDEQWGLLISAPVFLLVFVGVALMLRERGLRADLGWAALIFVPYFLVIANYVHWWGEWCPPARYLTSTLPVLAVPFSVALARARSGVGYAVLYGVLFVLSLGISIGFMYQPQWMYGQPYVTVGEERQIAPESHKVITYGLTGLLRSVGVSAGPAANFTASLSENLPSFVLPSLYYAQGQQVGVDYFAPGAWRASITPAAVGLGIVALGIALAWPAPRRRRVPPPEAANRLDTPPLEAT